MTQRADSACYRDDDPVSNSSTVPSFQDILSSRLTRRQSIAGIATWLGATTLGLRRSTAGSSVSPGDEAAFRELQRGLDETARGLISGSEAGLLKLISDPFGKNGYPVVKFVVNADVNAAAIGW